MPISNKATDQNLNAINPPTDDQQPITRHSKSSKLRRRLIGALLLILILGPYLYSRIQAPGRRVQWFDNLGRVEIERTFDGELSIISFNIAHGRGTADSNWTEAGPAKRERIAAIAQELKQIDADIVILNEVDFNSTWSGGQNQAEAIAVAAGYQYRVEQRNLDFGFVYGNWQFGNAILSHYPIVDAQQIDFPPEKVWEDWLVGGKRGALTSVRLAADKIIRVGAVHLEHRSETVRAAGADLLLKLSEDDEQSQFILAGDFNSTPDGFPNSNQPDGASNALDLIFESNAFHCVPKSNPQTHDFTFSTMQPKSVIDWIMVSRQAPEQVSPFTQYRVIDTTLSDHRLLHAIIKLD